MEHLWISRICLMMAVWCLCEGFHLQNQPNVRQAVCRRAAPCCPGHVCRAFQRFDESPPVAACALRVESRPMYAPGSPAQGQFCGRDIGANRPSSRFGMRRLPVGGRGQTFGRPIQESQQLSMNQRASAERQRVIPTGQVRRRGRGGNGLSQPSVRQWGQSTLGRSMGRIPQQRILGQRSSMSGQGSLNLRQGSSFLRQGPALRDFRGQTATRQGSNMRFGSATSSRSAMPSQPSFGQSTTDQGSQQLLGGQLNTFAPVPRSQQQFVQGHQGFNQGQQSLSGPTFVRQQISLPAQGTRSAQVSFSSQRFSQGRPDFSQSSQVQPDFSQFGDQSQSSQSQPNFSQFGDQSQSSQSQPNFSQFGDQSQSSQSQPNFSQFGDQSQSSQSQPNFSQFGDQSQSSQTNPNFSQFGDQSELSQGQLDLTQFGDQSQVGVHSFSTHLSAPEAMLVEQPEVQVEAIGGTAQNVITLGHGQAADNQQQEGSTVF